MADAPKPDRVFESDDINPEIEAAIRDIQSLAPEPKDNSGGRSRLIAVVIFAAISAAVWVAWLR